MNNTLIKETVIKIVTQHVEPLEAPRSKEVDSRPVHQEVSTKFIIKNGQPALTTHGDLSDMYIQPSGKFCTGDTQHQSPRHGAPDGCRVPDSD